MFHLIQALPSLGIMLAYLNYLDRTLRVHFQEHELLIADYCERHNIDVKDLPTRIRRK